MKRVLSLATLYPNAHSPRFGTFVARQMEALATRGDWDVTVINPIGVPPVALGRYRALAQAAVTQVSGGVTVHRPTFTLLPKLSGALNPRLIARAVLPLARRLHALAAFDLVDAQFFYPDGPAASQIARALGLPLSIKARGADISYWGTRPYAKRQILAAGDQAAGLLSVSAQLARDMAALGLPHGKITVHYTGVDHAVFRPVDSQLARQTLRLPAGPPILATVGALIPRKGQLVTLRALARLPEAHLLIVGTGPDRPMLDAFVGQAGLSERVHFTGSLDHEKMATVLAAADVMVLPSTSEGLANAWVEALACGTPLVISDVGGARELVTSPVFGRIVEREPEAIASAIRELLAAAQPRAAVAQGAAKFSWQANAAALADYYTRLLA